MNARTGLRLGSLWLGIGPSRTVPTVCWIIAAFHRGVMYDLVWQGVTTVPEATPMPPIWFPVGWSRSVY